MGKIVTVYEEILELLGVERESDVIPTLIARLNESRYWNTSGSYLELVDSIWSNEHFDNIKFISVDKNGVRIWYYQPILVRDEFESHDSCGVFGMVLTEYNLFASDKPMLFIRPIIRKETKTLMNYEMG